MHLPTFRFRLALTLALTSLSTAAYAISLNPYSAEAATAAQAGNKAVVLHFHADWCPTCRAQAAVLKQLEGDNSVPAAVLVVNFDKERELKKQLGVRAQLTFVVLKQGKEVARSGGETDANALRQFLGSAK